MMVYGSGIIQAYHRTTGCDWTLSNHCVRSAHRPFDGREGPSLIATTGRMASVPVANVPEDAIFSGAVMNRTTSALMNSSAGARASELSPFYRPTWGQAAHRRHSTGLSTATDRRKATLHNYGDNTDTTCPMGSSTGPLATRQDGNTHQKNMLMKCGAMVSIFDKHSPMRK